MATALNSRTVRRLMEQALFASDVNAEDAKARAVIVKGVTFEVGFDPDKLEAMRGTVTELVEQLTPRLNIGVSIIELSRTRDNREWGDSLSVESLMLLAIGLGIVQMPWPRLFWQFLPGSMPYVIRHVEGAPRLELPRVLQ